MIPQSLRRQALVAFALAVAQGADMIEIVLPESDLKETRRVAESIVGGRRPGEPLLILYDPTSLRLEVPVMENLAVGLKSGDELIVRLAEGQTPPPTPTPSATSTPRGKACLF